MARQRNCLIGGGPEPDYSRESRVDLIPIALYNRATFGKFVIIYAQ